jgi:hypothetical protein
VLPSSAHAVAEEQVELLLAAGGAAAGCCSQGGGAANLLSTSTDGARRLGPARQRWSSGPNRALQELSLSISLCDL